MRRRGRNQPRSPLEPPAACLAGLGGKRFGAMDMKTSGSTVAPPHLAGSAISRNREGTNGGLAAASGGEQ